MNRLFPLPMLLLFAVTADCQTLLLDGGTSTLFHGSGAQATMYLPNSTVSASIGYHDGHFLVGASDTFLVRDFKTTVGDQTLGFSFDGVGLGLALKGVSATRVWKERNDCARVKPARRLGPMGYLGNCRRGTSSVTAFVGATGVGFFTPFATVSRTQHVGTGILLQYSFRTLTLSSLDVVEGGKHTLAQGASYSGRRVKLAGSAGLLNSSKFASGSAVFQPIRSWSLYAAHQSYFVPYAARGNSAGMSLNLGRFNGTAALNESTALGRRITGQSIGAGVRLGPVTEQSTYYRSGQTILVHTITETMRHWTLTQAINQSTRGNSYSFGGGYSSNRCSISLTHSMQFVIGRGYERVTGVSLSFRIHDTVVNAQTVTDPFGKTQYGAYAESYVQTGLQVAGHETHSNGGKFVILGRCVETDGSPVEGCQAMVGRDTVYSNSHGEFELHERKNASVMLTVNTDEFSAPGSWVVVSAPVEVKPSDPVVIVVARKL